MKRIVSTIVGLAVAATMVHAAADEVTSVNGVGYVKKTVEPGKRYLMTANFENMLTGTIGDVLDVSELPIGTSVTIWDPVGQQYSSSEILSGFPTLAWNPGTNMLSVGQAFWLVVPSAAPNPSYEVTVSGEIPLALTNSVSLYPGLNFVTLPYPVEMALTDSQLGLAPEAGDVVSYWVPGTGWQSEIYVTFPSPMWSPGTYQVSLGEGFVYKSKAAGLVTWDAERPFSW